MSRTEVPESVRASVCVDADHRCGYCLSPQQYVMAKLEVEHIIPRSRGGADEEDNLWLSCTLCNRNKGSRVTGTDPLTGATTALFNPRTEAWREHFRWSPDGSRILGCTPTGRATVEALQLNNAIAVEVRRHWVLAGWHPPDE